MLQEVIRAAWVALILSCQGLARSDVTDHLDHPLQLQQPQALHSHTHPSRHLLDATTTPAAPPSATPTSTNTAAAAPAPAQVTAVRTPQQLRNATAAGARDIEIREHLDMRQLSRVVNPVAAADNEAKPADHKDLEFALLYAATATRSIRGNCSNPDAAAALGLSRADAAALLPLKPRQCLLLISDTLLMSNGGQLWLDNVYLKAMRQRVREDFAFVSAGADISFNLLGVEASELYVTNATLQSEPRRNSKGVVLAQMMSSALISDSIFSDWEGAQPPLRVAFDSAVHLRNTVFRNMRLAVELVDVSEGGAARFSNVSFANVTLDRGAVVSTTATDYEPPFLSYGVYFYAEDDAAYDVTVEPVPPAAAGLFAADMEIEDGIMSDCMHEFWHVEAVAPQPGCPERSLQQQARMRARNRGGSSVTGYVSQEYIDYLDSAYADGPGDGYGDYVYVYGPEYAAPGPAPDAFAYAPGYAFAPGYAYTPGPAVDSLGAGDDGEVDYTPLSQFEELVLDEEDPWFRAVRADLPAISTPPNWPSFKLEPPPVPANRTSLAPEPWSPLDHPGLIIVPPLDLSRPAPPPPTSAKSAEALSSGGIAAVASAAAVLLLLVAGGLYLRRRYMLRAGGGAKKGGADDTDRVCKSQSLISAGKGSWRTARAEFATSTVPSGVPSRSDPVRSLDPTKALHLWTLNGAAINTYGTYQTWESGPVEICPAGFSPRRLGAPTIETTRSESPDTSHVLAPPGVHHMLAARLDLAAEQEAVGPSQLLWDRGRAAGGGGAPPRRRPLSGSCSARGPLRPEAATATPTSARATAGSPMSARAGAGALTEPPPVMLCAADQSSLAAYSEGSTAVGGTVALLPYSDSVTTRSTDACMTNMHTEASLSSNGRTGATWRAAAAEHDSGVAAVSLSQQGSLDSGWPSSHIHGAQHDGNTQGHGKDTTRAPTGDIGMWATDVIAADRDVVALQRWLDARAQACAPDELFLGKYEILGREERRRGGQAVVQFVRGHRDRSEYAVKFFLDREAFRAEAALYSACAPAATGDPSPEGAGTGSTPSRRTPDALSGYDDGAGTTPAAPAHSGASPAAAHAAHARSSQMPRAAAQFLPKVEAVCDAGVGGSMGPRGRPLPPCIVMEKGESLQDWSERAQPDLFASLAVLSNISQRLADMHDAGYVHRDLKPGNVMWLPRENRWTVIDFGCAASIGDSAPLSFTLAYAAPEVVAAAMHGVSSIESTPALDAWSLGVMAYELMTGAPAFRLLTEGRCRVIAMLRGELPLPWEGGLSPEVQRKLGAFKGPVLALLQRDPAHRASMRRFQSDCTNIVASGTTSDHSQ